jgi:DNA-binding transcriptional regulator LsrR (DeoR family)
VIELYCQGYNQLEIAGILMISPLKIRRILKGMRKSLEWNIKTKKILEG